MIIAILFPSLGKTQIEMKKTGSYSQNFDVLISSGSASWTDNVTIPGWYWQYQIQNQENYKTYSAVDGTSTAIGKKSYGITGSSDRAMGFIPDYKDSYTFAIGLVLQNKSSTPISQISISYTGEQWRNGGFNSPQPIKFGYQIQSTLNAIFTSGTNWKAISELNFNSPKFGIPYCVLNGNDPENSTVFKDIPITDITIPPNSYLLLRWFKQPEQAYPHGLAIDDVTIKWTVPAVPSLSTSIPAITDLSGIQDNIGSTSKHYTVSGEDLPVEGNPIIITAPANYEISLDNQIFSSSISLSYTPPTLPPKTIYVRFSSAAKAGSYSNSLITHSIGGIVLNSFPVSGTVYLIDWIENFETGTKTDYTEGSVACTQGPWLFKDALIGTSAEDFKWGNKSVRLHTNSITNTGGSISMNFNKTNGAGDVLIGYSNFGSDKGGKWQLQSSVNSGSTWENEGSEIVCGDDHETAHFSINKSGNIRFRIIQSVTAIVSAINIDNIAISDYGSSSSLRWTGAISEDWSIAGNWMGGVVPGVDADAEIPNVVNKPICNNDISLKSLIIKSGAVLTLKAGITLTVSGNSSLEGTNCMLLKSPANHGAAASFICNGKISGGGTITAERFIMKYIGETDGWHLISSPVDSPLISDSFKPNPNDDLFAYRESDNLWINQKLGSNNLISFTNGEGYLASYYTDLTRSISGIPNNTDISFSNLTLTNNRGWHLLGNPFTSGITWLTGWNALNINAIAKVLNSGGTYSDMDEGETIPAMNGFFIRAINSTNSITIPTSARVHAINNGWKSKTASVVKKIKLIVNSTSDNTYSETKININDKATALYDAAYDSPFLEGMNGTPSLYTILSDGQKLSTNSVPPFSSQQFNLQFSKGLSDEYTFKSEISDDWLKSATFILEDKLDKKKYSLSNTSSFTFKSDSLDTKDRFALKIDVLTGLDDASEDKKCSLYSFEKTVFIKVPDLIKTGNVTVYDVSGRLFKRIILQNSSYNFQIEKSGTYIIKVEFNNKIFSRIIRIN